MVVRSALAVIFSWIMSWLRAESASCNEVSTAAWVAVLRRFFKLAAVVHFGSKEVGFLFNFAGACRLAKLSRGSFSIATLVVQKK